MTGVAVLTADNDNISDSQHGGEIWDVIREAVHTPQTLESVILVEIGLLWSTVIQSGDDPYMEYRVMRSIGGGALEEIFGPAILDASRGDPPRNRFGFLVYDKPATSLAVAYQLQARGRGYDFSTMSTCYGTQQVWVPPVTRIETETQTTYGSFTECVTEGVLPGAPSGCTATSYNSGFDSSCSDPPLAVTVSYECSEEIETEVEVEPGYYTTESYSFPCGSSGYQSSNGLVSLKQGTSIHACEIGTSPLPLAI